MKFIKNILKSIKEILISLLLTFLGTISYVIIGSIGITSG
jgi:hypothetical protein